MKKVLTIAGVDAEVRLRMRIICAVRGVSMSQLLATMVGWEWNQETAAGTGDIKRVARRLVKQAFSKHRRN
jgi:hypothetical protein